MKYANCHLHSTYSDAQFTPAQLVLIGKSLGYRALVLTDHETDGGVKPFMAAAMSEGIQTVSGAEFYGDEGGENLHIVALDYDMDDPGIRAFIQERCDLEAERTRKCLELGLRLGVISGITWNDVLDHVNPGTWICIDSVINTMKAKRVVDTSYDWYRMRMTCFRSPEAKAFSAPIPSAEQVIRIIRKAGGVAGLAHPYKQTHYVEKLVSYGLNGIEISHPDLYENSAYLALQAADTFNLYHCGGTDHTGPMSGCGGKLAIPVFNGITEEEFTTLKERRLG